MNSKDASSKTMLSDPMNKGIEHFSGTKAEDVAMFRVWRAKTYKYLERFIPGTANLLVK